MFWIYNLWSYGFKNVKVFSFLKLIMYWESYIILRPIYEVLYTRTYVRSYNFFKKVYFLNILNKAYVPYILILILKCKVNLYNFTHIN